MEENNKFIVPAAIVIAGALIAGALYYGGNGNSNPSDGQVAGDSLPSQAATKLDFSEDYILGNPEAPIKLVEYADTNCRFCRSFIPTLNKIMNEYGENGQVAWIYRHFSILGPSSVTEAQAAECAGELGGNEKFWEYVDHLFLEAKDEGARFLPGQSIETVASAVGLNPEKLTTCVKSEKYLPKIQSQSQMAQAAGGQGTPFSLIADKDGNIIEIVSGAESFENVKAAIERALANL